MVPIPAQQDGAAGDRGQRQGRLHAAAELSCAARHTALRERDGAYYITESYLTGKPQEHRVDYTLGNRRIQHYLTTSPSGRVIVLPPSWDVLRKQWFHNFEIGDPDETSEVTGPGVEQELLLAATSASRRRTTTGDQDEYTTAWLDFGTNCERCHGPGSEHVAHYSARRRRQRSGARHRAADAPGCRAQHHGLRAVPLLPRHHRPGLRRRRRLLRLLHADPRIQPAGGQGPRLLARRPHAALLQRRVRPVAERVLSQGRRDVRGLPRRSRTRPKIERNPQLAPDANALCTRCHEAIGRRLTAHTHHAASSAGSSCVECHMPRTVLSIKAEIRDHSMSVPVPENTIRHGIPNACNQCHKDRDAAMVAGAR